LEVELCGLGNSRAVSLEIVYGDGVWPLTSIGGKEVSKGLEKSFENDLEIDRGDSPASTVDGKAMLGYFPRVE